MSKRIIIIEDDEFIREIYSRELKMAGYDTVAYAKGNDGLTAMLQENFDLVLLDIMLPDINGLQVLKQIKETEKTKAIPVVMLTNLGQDEVIREAFGLGAIGYMVKAAYNPDQTVAEIKNVLEGRGVSTPTN